MPRAFVKFFVSVGIVALAACTSGTVAKPRTPADSGEVNQDLSVISWNVKHLGREVFNSAQASPLLSDADIVTLQEVNTTESGLRALMGLAAHLRELIVDERFCLGLSEIPNGAKERYAYLWKNSRVSYVKTNGEILVDCPSSALTIPLDRNNARSLTRPPALGTFFFKPNSRKFILASVHLPPTGKKPYDEVPTLFGALNDSTFPIVVAGDYNLSSKHKSFAVARSLGFQAALVGVKTSLRAKRRELSQPYDNFWFRGVEVTPLPAGRMAVMNLYEIFPEKDQKEIYDNFSDHCPIISKFKFLD